MHLGEAKTTDYVATGKSKNSTIFRTPIGVREDEKPEKKAENVDLL